ncbi:MAG: hypothetical protein AAFV77_09515 [Planctomycetota bacterium]
MISDEDLRAFDELAVEHSRCVVAFKLPHVARLAGELFSDREINEFHVHRCAENSRVFHLRRVAENSMRRLKRAGAVRHIGSGRWRVVR